MSDDSHLAAGVREGDVLAGKYRIDQILGMGGMGVVVAAHHIQLDDRVAIKFLLPAALENKEAVARFAREARAAVKIKSEHVARVSDVGTLENGAPFMVMEYLDGSDLSGWLQRSGALPIEQAIDFVLQACEALAEAHALGIVHRDLKPANLFVIRRPDSSLCVKVLDFGISKTTGPGGVGSSLTQTSAIMGSPLYMSPEQLQSSKDADARSDIWSLGVILYELITAESPFTGDTMPELVLKIMSAPPPRLRNTRPDAPEGLEPILLKCVDKDRGKRFDTVGELAVALMPFGTKRARVSVERISGVMKAAGLSGTALVVPPSSEQDVRPASATAASWGRTTLPRARGPRMIVLGIGAVAALGVVVAVMRKPNDANGSASSSASAAGSGVPAAQVSAVSAQPSESAPPPSGERAAFSATPGSSAASPPSPASANASRKSDHEKKSGPTVRRDAPPAGALVAPSPTLPLAEPPVPATPHPAPPPMNTSTMFDDRK